MNSSVELGFIEECDFWKLESRFFPSKIGGKPAWLDLKDIPRTKDIQCQICSNPCLFLCQIYAPFDDNPSTFHRTLFVFICRNESCCKTNCNKNLRVLRSQLPRENPYYPLDPPVEQENWRTDITVTKFAKTCRICNIFAPSHCSKCKAASYCSREHQIEDWRSGHKEDCGKPDAHHPRNSNLLFPEYELITEPEDIDEDDEDDDYDDEEDDEDEGEKERIELDKFRKMVDEGEAGTLQSEKNVDEDLMKMAGTDEDATFAAFQSAVSRNSDQVLRYQRGGKPLYISKEGQVKDVPKCENCGSKRQFEFQIMPQLLNYLNFTDIFKSLDWGIIAVFTCEQSCVPKSGYAEEFIWKQDLVENKS